MMMDDHAASAALVSASSVAVLWFRTVTNVADEHGQTARGCHGGGGDGAGGAGEGGRRHTNAGSALAIALSGDRSHELRRQLDV